jgi:predicted nucleic acid-binding protein
MKVLVDTCVWSAVLRRKHPDLESTIKLDELVTEGRVALIGPIRQELLSGIIDAKQFYRIEEILAAFEDLPLRTEHFVKAAEFANTCRGKGIQGSSIDFLICSVAHLEKMAIFTTDKDFENYRKHLPIRIIH